MSFIRCVALAAVVGCGLTATEASAGDDRPPAPDDAAIKAFVAYLGKNGVKLEADEGNYWVVTDPKGDGYKVIVSLKTFPPGTSEKDMQAALQMINLAHMLNAPSRLAMSHPGLRATDPAKQLPKLDQIPVAAKLEKLFKEYRPPEPAK
jgi:hypothetical protein